MSPDDSALGILVPAQGEAAPSDEAAGSTLHLLSGVTARPTSLAAPKPSCAPARSESACALASVPQAVSSPPAASWADITEAQATGSGAADVSQPIVQNASCAPARSVSARALASGPQADTSPPAASWADTTEAHATGSVAADVSQPIVQSALSPAASALVAPCGPSPSRVLAVDSQTSMCSPCTPLDKLAFYYKEERIDLFYFAEGFDSLVDPDSRAFRVELCAASPRTQKHMIGNVLQHRVNLTDYAPYSSVIVGAILTWDNADILDLFGSEQKLLQALRAIVHEITDDAGLPVFSLLSAFIQLPLSDLNFPPDDDAYFDLDETEGLSL